jgi:hypothetical protein
MATEVLGAGQPLADDRAWHAWLAGWVGASVIAIVNGIARRVLYEERVGSMAAQYVATAGLLVLLGGYMWLLARRWPIPTRPAALLIGGAWTALTIVFEFGLGRYVVGDSWAKLLEQYDLTRGYVWILIPIWTAIGPALMRGLRMRQVTSEREARA